MAPRYWPLHRPRSEHHAGELLKECWPGARHQLCHRQAALRPCCECEESPRGGPYGAGCPLRLTHAPWKALVLQALPHLAAAHAPHCSECSALDVFLYSSLCPCSACTLAICSAQRELAVNITLVYERDWVPEKHGEACNAQDDSEAVRTMQSCGVQVQKLTFSDAPLPMRRIHDK